MKDEEERKATADYRRKNFRARCHKENYHSSDEFSLSVTHNGWQWTSIGLNSEEIDAVIACLKNYKKHL